MDIEKIFGDKEPAWTNAASQPCEQDDTCAQLAPITTGEFAGDIAVRFTARSPGDAVIATRAELEAIGVDLSRLGTLQ